MKKITERDIKFMEMAIEMSAKSVRSRRAPGGPFGAIIVKNNRVIGRGYNHVIANNDPTAHGEIMAIRDACAKIKGHDLSGCTLYTSCRPCPMCLAAIRWANISDIYYAADSRDAESIDFRDRVLYREFKNPDFGTKIKQSVADALWVMNMWRQKFMSDKY
jgi:tRNA(Arg) A34 adenosine deaminase TadA